MLLRTAGLKDLLVFFFFFIPVVGFYLKMDDAAQSGDLWGGTEQML